MMKWIMVFITNSNRIVSFDTTKLKYSFNSILEFLGIFEYKNLCLIYTEGVHIYCLYWLLAHDEYKT